MILSQFPRKSCSNNIHNINHANDSSVLEAGRAYGTVHLADPTSKLIWDTNVHYKEPSLEY